MTDRGEVRPIMAESPKLGQPPLLLKVSMASFAVARGAITHSGMMIANCVDFLLAGSDGIDS